MLRMRFWPMTARPMRAISAVGSMFVSAGNLSYSMGRARRPVWLIMCLMARVANFPGGNLDQLGILVPDLEAAMDGYIASLGVTFQVFEVDESTSAFSGSSSHFRI